MEARELRIGNLIYKFGIDYIMGYPVVDRSEKEVISVDLDVLKNIQEFNSTTDYYYTEPIPITKEWLLKFGLIKKKNNRFIHEELGFEVEIQGRFVAYVIWGGQDAPFLTKFIGHCEFVHEFQNLIFSLHKKELTTNPPRS